MAIKNQNRNNGNYLLHMYRRVRPWYWMRLSTAALYAAPEAKTPEWIERLSVYDAAMWILLFLIIEVILVWLAVFAYKRMAAKHRWE